MVDLPAGVEQQLADLSDADFAALTARVRAPDSTEALRTAAARVLSEDAANSFVAFADVSKFVGANGRIDEVKVRDHLAAAYGVPQGAGGNQEWGRPGAAGRAAAEKRFGQKLDPDAEATAGSDTPGAAGRAAAQRRFGKPQKES
ncbi:hypothetical protein [Mycobacterium interjectum]|uniref:hypothetical protein n=1 Tax=Mycobacterium interjectum TaxID=33895 RepID=UPI00083745BE|nr:hypothetical protein [Mycobacterium interjectum]MCV7088887.1 hypothetical protein [Mycobacterium interjectum]